jgi:hypothetical protein
MSAKKVAITILESKSALIGPLLDATKKQVKYDGLVLQLETDGAQKLREG